MNFLIQILFILVIFFKTGNLLSENNLFNVNNIILEKKNNISNADLANLAINDAFNRLIKKVLLREDIKKIPNLNNADIKELVKYYNITKEKDLEKDKVNFSVTFDKEKMHNLFYNREVSYSDFINKEFYILPIAVSENEIFIFSNNYFYKNWNTNTKDELIELLLPLENIEIIQNINRSKKNLLNLELNILFKDYPNKNIALVLIDNSNSEEKKIYLKARIRGKMISKNINLNMTNLQEIKFNKLIILKIKEEIVDLVKSQNLIDIRTPSFLNARFDLKKKSNLFLLNSKIKNIDLIENIFVQEFNKDYVKLRIKYLGKFEKIIKLLNNENIILQNINNQWLIEVL